MFSYDYDAWGRAKSNKKLDVYGVKVDVVNYTGYNYNEYNKLYYAVNRMYDADTYSFTSEDRRVPDITRPSSFETYAYAENNPMTYIDPTGLGIIKDAVSWVCDKVGGLVADTIETVSDIITNGLEKIHKLTVSAANILNINEKVFRTGVNAGVATGAALATGIGLPTAIISLCGIIASGAMLGIGLDAFKTYFTGGTYSDFVCNVEESIYTGTEVTSMFYAFINGYTASQMNAISEASGGSTSEIYDTYNTYKKEWDEISEGGSKYGIDVDNLDFSNTVSGHGNRPYQDSKLLINEIINSSEPIQDPQGTNALYWEVDGSFSNSNGTYELLIDPETNTVWHFVYKSK